MSYDHMWNRLREQNPEHSRNYAQRWKDLAAAGHDLDGEARLADAMSERGARILDAGCGTGRVGGYLAARGHEVVGIDLDDFLISAAEEEHPEAQWFTGDLAVFDFAQAGITEVDLVVCAGNVLAFLDPKARAATLGNIAQVMATDGRFVCGFGAGRGYGFSEFTGDLLDAGLVVDSRFSTWDLRPFSDDSDFLVLIASKGRR